MNFQGPGPSVFPYSPTGQQQNQQMGYQNYQNTGYLPPYSQQRQQTSDYFAPSGQQNLQGAPNYAPQVPQGQQGGGIYAPGYNNFGPVVQQNQPAVWNEIFWEKSLCKIN